VSHLGVVFDDLPEVVLDIINILSSISNSLEPELVSVIDTPKDWSFTDSNVSESTLELNPSITVWISMGASVESVDLVDIVGTEDLAVTDFELSKVSIASSLSLPSITIRSLESDSGSSVRNTINIDTPDSTLEADGDVLHVGWFSNPAVSFSVQGVDSLSVVDVVGSGGSPDLLMESARDLSEFTVGGFPSGSVVDLFTVELPVVTGKVIVVDSGSVVDQVVSISGPDHAVVAHSDVEEVHGLLVEDVAPAVTLWKGLHDTGSEEGSTFSIDTDELGVVARIDLDQSVSSVVLDQGPTVFDVVDVGSSRDITSDENPNVIFRIDGPNNTFLSSSNETLSTWNSLPRSTLEVTFINTESSIWLIKHVDGPEFTSALVHDMSISTFSNKTHTSIDVLPLTFKSSVDVSVLS